jgi:hypothetical protein
MEISITSISGNKIGKCDNMHKNNCKSQEFGSTMNMYSGIGTIVGITVVILKNRLFNLPLSILQLGKVLLTENCSKVFRATEPGF